MFGKTRSSRLWISSRQTAHRRHFAASGGFALPAENINHHNGNHKNKRSQRHPPASSGFRFFFIFVHASIIKGLSFPVFHQQSRCVQTATRKGHGPADTRQRDSRYPLSLLRRYSRDSNIRVYARQRPGSARTAGTTSCSCFGKMFQQHPFCFCRPQSAVFPADFVQFQEKGIFVCKTGQIFNGRHRHVYVRVYQFLSPPAHSGDLS